MFCQPKVSCRRSGAGRSNLTAGRVGSGSGSSSSGGLSESGQISQNHTSDGSRQQGRDTASDKGRHDQTGNVTSTARSELREHTNVGTHTTQVGETTESVGGKHTATDGKVGVVGAGKRNVGNELVLNDLDTNELGNVVELVTGDTEEEGNGVEDVAKDLLKGQLLNVPETGKPAEEGVDQGNEGNDTQQVGKNGTGNHNSEPGTVGKSVQGVVGSLGLVVGDDDTTISQSGLLLRVSQLGGGQRGRNRHDTGGNQGLGRDAKGNVGNEHGTGNGSETRGHDLVVLGLGQVGSKGLDENGRLTLANEGGSSGDDGLSTRHAHGPVEEDGELANEPLHNSNVVENVDKGNEEDNGGNDVEEEHSEVGDGWVGDEGRTVLGERQQLAGEERDKVKDIVTSTGSQDKQSHNELHKHSSNDSMPVNLGSVVGGEPETKDSNNTAKEGDGALRTGSAALDLRGGKGSDQNDGQGTSSSGEQTESFRNELDNLDNSALPNPVGPDEEVLGGEVKGNQTSHDEHPEEGRNKPLGSVSFLGDNGNPPGGEEQAPEDVDDPHVLAVHDLPSGHVLELAHARLLAVGSYTLFLGVDIRDLFLSNVLKVDLGVDWWGRGGSGLDVGVGVDDRRQLGRGCVVDVAVEVLMMRVKGLILVDAFFLRHG